MSYRYPVALLLVLLPYLAQAKSAKVDIRAVGDAAHIGGNKHFAGYEKGWVRKFLRAMQPLRSPDVNLLNLEAALTRSCSTFSDKPFGFATGPETIAAFAVWGFNLIGLANNHSIDCIDPSPESELKAALAAARAQAPAAAMHGVAPTSAGLTAVARLRIRGVRIGMVALKAWSSGANSLVANLDNRAAVFAALRDAKVDVRILSLHGGVESTRRPANEVIDVAREFVARYKGDVVFAHHPHVSQGLELLRRSDGRAAAIFYSLGNFLHPGLSARGDGMLARVLVSKDGLDAYSASVFPLANATVEPRPIVWRALRSHARQLRDSSAAAATRPLPRLLDRIGFRLKEVHAPAPGFLAVP